MARVIQRGVLTWRVWYKQVYRPEEFAKQIDLKGENITAGADARYSTTRWGIARTVFKRLLELPVEDEQVAPTPVVSSTDVCCTRLGNGATGRPVLSEGPAAVLRGAMGLPVLKYAMRVPGQPVQGACRCLRLRGKPYVHARSQSLVLLCYYAVCGVRYWASVYYYAVCGTEIAYAATPRSRRTTVMRSRRTTTTLISTRRPKIPLG
eukprot:213350-Rhodomonas_salina.1